ncbi:hypothetical protein ACFL4V_01020 [Candidatus Latescibacterota bacterium]
MSIFPYGFLSGNTGYYFYSAILQANAAILSIVGVFIIFRIQRLQSTIDIIINSFMTDLERWTNPQWILDFFNSNLEEKKEKYKSYNYERQAMSRFSECIKNEEKLLKIKSIIYIPTLFLSSGIILSTIGLFFYELST